MGVVHLERRNLSLSYLTPKMAIFGRFPATTPRMHTSAVNAVCWPSGIQ
jgi:hypothetical protein